MDILILGNGFDIAHCLKTKYSDFLDYCVEKNNKRMIGTINYGTTFIDNIWLQHFITTRNNYGKNWIDIEEEIYQKREIVIPQILPTMTITAHHFSHKLIKNMNIMERGM